MATQFGASSSSSSSAPIQSSTYHVFLSFRGEDTRNTFTGHLHSNLVQKGIRTFIDDGLRRGEEISSALLKAIEESKIAVIVFSENYASSKWCLEELVKIMQCNESKQQIVHPIFYNVDPSDVRRQTGSFGKALAQHDNPEEVAQWKRALTKAGNLAGWTFSQGHFGEALAQHDNLEKVAQWKRALTKAGNLAGWTFSQGQDESKFIGKIVQEISQQVSNLTYVNRDKYLVGMESRLEYMDKLLCVGERDVRMVGVWGIGGLGKTTIARAVYNSIAHKFEGSCFLENVRENSLIPRGLEELQKFLLCKTLGLKELKVNSLDEGSTMIEERLSQKRVLFILDDVNDLKQLKYLAGQSTWFGSGSRIIITTRDKHLLRGHDVNQIYEVDKLSHDEALDVFKFNAFKGEGYMSDYVELMDDVVRFAEGIPLVLEVIGSYLHGTSIDTWKDALEYYKRNPERQQFLKLSYDTLDILTKEVFLHIACFFKGEEKNYVMDILGGCDLPKHGIEVLIEKALIKITEANSIWMHDMLEEMGKEIVCQESSEPGERSRLWLYKDVYHVFVRNIGTNKVKGIMVKKDIADQGIPLNGQSFSKLTGLRILLIYNDVFCGGRVDYLPNELSVLVWMDCPLRYFPSNFYPQKLVILRMHFLLGILSLLMPATLTKMKIDVQRKIPWICISPLGEGPQILPNLKSLCLAFCNAVTCSDFSRFPNLEELIIRHSDHLKKFEIGKEMKFLKRLDLTFSSIKELPSSAIGHLINLEQLTLAGCWKLKHVPCNIFELQHLQLLNLERCSKLVTFPTKPEFSTESTSLQDKHYAPLLVKMWFCENLEEIGESPREIYGLDVTYCYSLKRISKLSNILEGKESRMIPWMFLFGCDELFRSLASEVAKMKKNLPDDSELTALFSLFFSCRQSKYQVWFISSTNIPEWFTCRMDVKTKGLHQVCNFRIDFPENFKWDDKGLAFYALRSGCIESLCFRVLRISINGVSITQPSEKLSEHCLYYMPFDAIIKRLSESGLPPPSTCLVQFEALHRKRPGDSEDEDGDIRGSYGVHVVMPGWEGPLVNGVLYQRTDSYPEDDAEDRPTI